MPRGNRRKGYAKVFRIRPPFPRPKIRKVLSYARFYGLYVNKKGETKRFSFQVRINPRYSNKLVGRLVRVVCNMLLDKNIPEHRMGQIFPSFWNLIKNARWIRVEKLLDYKAGVQYVR